MIREVRRLRDEISEKKLAISTVTKGIPFNKIEVRPDDQLPPNSFQSLLTSPSKKPSVSLPLPYAQDSPALNSASLAAAALQAQRQLEGISSAKNTTRLLPIIENGGIAVGNGSGPPRGGVRTEAQTRLFFGNGGGGNGNGNFR